MSVQELQGQLKQVETEALTAIEIATSTKGLEDLRQQFLGQKGSLTTVLRGLGQLSKEERPLIGQLANEVKETITASLNKQLAGLESKELEARV
ncbi:MAG: hypothetical protein K2X81_10755, partial [Candidatus Obscuribacterales bacterium]|nr:hypothetical protein [Candidatus Obscuribacterales bacterium]